MHTHRPTIAALALIATLSAAPAARVAAPITATATGTGSYTGAPSLLTVPGENRLVVWNASSTLFTLDVGPMGELLRRRVR